ncbi:MAG TPA: dual specificity protein phosphatase [Gemmataceae bacterium]|nr:dual specificity protein phosphatase [Gemmataceae bacterium]
MLKRKPGYTNKKKWWQILLALVFVSGLAVWLALLWLERSYREEPYSLIEGGLYLGSSVPEPPPGTKAVLNLCGRKDSYAVDKLLWEPILEGGKDPDLAWLERMVEFIDGQRQAGRITYVHCLAGMNRSGMVVTAYLMSRHNWSRDQALKFVQSKRPQIQPNPMLIRLLGEWEKELNKRATNRDFALTRET